MRSMKNVGFDLLRA